MLESRVLLGHFDAETPFDHLTRADVNTDADKALNRRAAREGMVLLDNHKSVLPLDAAKVRRIGLFGCNADVNLKDWYTGMSPYLVSIRQGLEERGIEVVYDLGWDIVKVQAPNGRFLCIGEDDCLYADADEENAAEFYLCIHDDQNRWVNLRHVQSGRYLNLEHKPHLGENEVYGWFTRETMHLDWYCRSGESGYVFSDYQYHDQLTLDGSQRVVNRCKARPDKSVLFQLKWTSHGYARLRDLSADCDAILYCGGNDPMQVARECFDRRTIDLPSDQIDHVTELAAALGDTPFIFAMVSSYPYALGDVLDNDEHIVPDAILWTNHAGPELGHAFADTIFGENNPAGRLPQTWYACDEDLPDIKDYNIMQTRMTYRWFDGKALYPFGYGLSYSAFRYENMQAAQTPDGIRVTFSVTNTSGRDGDEVVQLYAHARSERIARPVKQLIAFERVRIKAGETVEAELFAPNRELLIWDVSRERFLLEAGDYDLMVGASSEDIRLTQTLSLDGETVPPRDISTPVRAELWDHQWNTEIFTDPMTGATHVRGTKWDNALIFQNCDLTGKTQFTLRAASPIFNAEVKICLDQSPEPALTLQIPACDGFTDFTDVTGELSADGCHDVRISFGELICVESFHMA